MQIRNNTCCCESASVVVIAQRVAYRNLLPLGDREGAISGQVRRPACVIEILDLQDYGLESKYFYNHNRQVSGVCAYLFRWG